MSDPSAPAPPAPAQGAARPPGASPAPGSYPPPVPLHLQYATPKAEEPWGPDHPLLRVVRQVVFAVGLALLLYGLTSALAEVNRGDAPLYAAWGAGFIGLATPLWRVTKDPD